MRQSRAIMLASAFILCAAARVQGQQNFSVGPRIRIGVMDLTGTALSIQTTATPTSSSTSVALPPPSDFARGLTQMLTTSLAGQPEFIVVERTQLDKILAEQQLAAAGKLEPKSAASVGRLLGAQAIITGDITEFSYQQTSAGSKMSILKAIDSKLGAKMDRLTAQVAIDLRIVDATTGVVIGSVRGEGKASATGVNADYSKEGRELGVGGSRQTPLGAASREAIDHGVASLVKQLREVSWQGRIADVRGEKIYINAGSDIGLRTGMQFDVFEQSEAIVDPESGATLGAPDTREGQVMITEVLPKFSVAKLVNGATPKKNDVVRFNRR